MARRLILWLSLAATLGCASSGSGGGASAMLLDECYSDYCVGYTVDNHRYLYFRTPGTALTVPRGSVLVAETGPHPTRLVDRSSVTLSATSPAAARPSSPPESRSSAPAVVHRP